MTRGKKTSPIARPTPLMSRPTYRRRPVSHWRQNQTASRLNPSATSLPISISAMRNGLLKKCFRKLESERFSAPQCYSNRLWRSTLGATWPTAGPGPAERHCPRAGRVYRGRGLGRRTQTALRLPTIQRKHWRIDRCALPHDRRRAKPRNRTRRPQRAYRSDWGHLPESRAHRNRHRCPNIGRRRRKRPGHGAIAH